MNNSAVAREVPQKGGPLMKNRIMRNVSAICAVSVAMVNPLPGDTASDPKREACATPSPLCTYLSHITNQLVALQADVQRLKREVLEMRVDRQRFAVARADLELQEVLISRRASDERDEALKREVSEAEQRTRDSGITPEQRAEAESTRAELTTSGAEKLQSERITLQARESELRQNLELEKQRLREAESALRLLTGESSR
jgi:hypothetical protein